MRKRTCFLIALSAVFSIGLSAAPASGGLKSTVIWRRFDDPFQSGFRIIMQSQADKMGGFSLDMQDGEDDPSRTINKLETTLTKGVKSIAICAPDRASTQKLMEKCKADDVPVVFFNMEPLPETMAAYDKIWYVGANAKESGQMCAQALINYWNKNKKFADKNGDGVLQLVVLQGEIGQQDVVLRTQAYEETLKAQGIKYKIVAMDTANWDKAQALDKMNAWFTAFGGEGIEGVLCNSDGMAMGAVQSALNHGYNKGDAKKFIPIVGIDATVEALQSMKDGALLGTVLNDRMGQSTAVLNVLKAISGGKAITKSSVGVNCTIDGKYVWVPYAIVDKSNLSDTLNLMLKLEGK
jgi:methyl-galactoside transport system substrate-binding protein